jgi:hypothetical protein
MLISQEFWKLKSALLDLTMKRFLETLILRSEFSEIIAPFSNALKSCNCKLNCYWSSNLDAQLKLPSSPNGIQGVRAVYISSA